MRPPISTAGATAHFEALERVGVDFTDVTDTLEREGLAKFEDSWTELTAMLDREMRAAATNNERGGSPQKSSGGADLLAIYLNDHLSGATMRPGTLPAGRTGSAIPGTGHRAGRIGPRSGTGP